MSALSAPVRFQSVRIWKALQNSPILILTLWKTRRPSSSTAMLAAPALSRFPFVIRHSLSLSLYSSADGDSPDWTARRERTAQTRPFLEGEGRWNGFSCADWMIARARHEAGGNCHITRRLQRNRRVKISFLAWSRRDDCKMSPKLVILTALIMAPLNAIFHTLAFLHQSNCCFTLCS